MGRHDHAKPGSRDRCFYCGKIIDLRKVEASYHRQVWMHLESGILACEGATQQRATPRLWCSESINSSWTSNLCSRPATVPEWHMCGIHANAKRKAEKREKERREKDELREYVKGALEDAVEFLNEEYELKAKIEFEPWSDEFPRPLTGRISVDPTALINLLTELVQEERF